MGEEGVDDLRGQAAALPTMPGVYRFHGRNDGELVYVGKSINLRKRVQSHLTAAKTDAREAKLVALSRQLSFTVTPGELSALLLESEEVKEKQPLLNRRLRRQKRLFTYQLIDQQEQPLNVALVDACWPPPSGDLQYYGLFASRHQAQQKLRTLAAQHQLCLVALGLESSRRGCFGYQLRKCRGVCVGQESVEQHNARFLSAVADEAVKAWPFSGPVGIVETGHAEWISVIDQWYYLGSASTLAEARQRATVQQDHRTLLDRDAYRIVSRWLLAPPESAHVITL